MTSCSRKTGKTAVIAVISAGCSGLTNVGDWVP